MTPAVQAAIDLLAPDVQSLASGELSFATSADASLRVMRAIDNPAAGLEDIARIVAAEPLLSAKVIRMANSVALNPAGQDIADLRQAVLRIGITPVRSLAMVLMLDQLRHSPRLAACRQLANRLWERSIHVAALAYVIARRLSPLPADEAMLAGIVHDLGRFYLLNVAAEKHADLLKDQPSLLRVLDALADSAGGRLLATLGLPASTVAAVAGHACFSGSMPPQKLSDVLFLACWLAPPASPFEEAGEHAGTKPQEAAAWGLDQQTIADFVSASGDEIYSIVLALEA